MLPVAVLPLPHGEAPSFSLPLMTHGEQKGQRPELLSQVSNKRAGGLVSHTSLGTCSVIVSVSSTAFGEVTRGR